MGVNGVKSWNDETTGRRIRQMTDMPLGAHTSYFRLPHNIPGGWVIIAGHVEQHRSNIFCLHIDSGELRDTSINMRDSLFLREQDGRLFYRDGRHIWAINLPDGQPEPIGSLPDEVPGKPVIITCDGRVVISQVIVDPDVDRLLADISDEPDTYWNCVYRRRSTTLYAYDLVDKTSRLLWHNDTRRAHHLDPSPTDPTLFKFAPDGPAMYEQRILAARVTEGEAWKIYPQQRGELTVHEFWWPDGLHIGYKYQDRRDDPTVRELPYAEYAPVPTRFCIADVNGDEIYRSDPINCWHTHICVSPDAMLLSGEGTHDHMFVYAALFDQKSTTIDFIPLATLHSKYHPFSAAMVNSVFLADCKTLIYGDTIDGKLQVCAVEVDL